MTDTSHTPHPKTQIHPDFEVFPESHSPLNPRLEWRDTAPKRAYVNALMTTAFNLKNRPDDALDLNQLTKVGNLIVTMEKSLREDVKINNALVPKLGGSARINPVPKKTESRKERRVRILAEFCGLAGKIKPEDYDLVKLEALIKSEDTTRSPQTKTPLKPRKETGYA